MLPLKLVTEPTIKLEYADTTSAWFNVATENYVSQFVSNCQVVLTGDVTGTGSIEVPVVYRKGGEYKVKFVGSGVQTVLSDLIKRQTPNHTFLFQNPSLSPAGDYGFNLSIPNNADYAAMNLRMNRQQTAQFGSGAGYEFQFYAPSTGIDTFALGYNNGSEFMPIFSTSNDKRELSFNQYRLTDLQFPVNPNDAATKGYVDSVINKKIIILRRDEAMYPINIETQTYGQLSPSRLKAFPSQKQAFLRGDGVWAKPVINELTANDNVSLSGFRLRQVGYPIDKTDAATVQYVDQKCAEILEKINKYFKKT